MLAVLWLFIRGVTGPLNLVQETIIGLIVGLGTAFVLRRMYTGEVHLTGMVGKLPLVALYIFDFLKELTFANIDVAKRVVLPSAEIHPDVIEYRLRLTSSSAITILANSITLTPGTLTMDYDDKSNSFFIHTLNGNGNTEEVLKPIKNWEDMLLKIFGDEE